MGGTMGTNHLAKEVPHGKQGKMRRVPYCGDGFGYMWNKPEWDRMIAGESMLPCIACQRALERDAALEELQKLKESLVVSTSGFELAFRRDFKKGHNEIVMVIHPKVDYSSERVLWKGYIKLTMVEVTIRDKDRALIEDQDGLIIGNKGYLINIERSYNDDLKLSVVESKILIQAYQAAIQTAEHMIEMVKASSKFVDVYTAIGGHQHEHEIAMKQDLGMIQMSIRPVGKCFMAFTELWESLDELKAYYLSRFPNMTFELLEQSKQSVAELRAEGRHLVRKGQRTSA